MLKFGFKYLGYRNLNYFWSPRCATQGIKRWFSSPIEVVERFEPKIRYDDEGNQLKPDLQFVPNVGFVDGQGNKYGVSPDDDDYELPSSYGVNPALINDFWEFYPKEHEATLIWLPGLGETYGTAKNLFEMLQTQGLRFAVPNPPKLSVTALGDKVEHAWFDIISETYSKSMEEDLDGLQESTRLLHDFINEEAYILGKRFTPEGTPLEKVLQIGARRIFVGGFSQGGALALHGCVRYPHRLAGIISFSGYFPFAEETLKSSNETHLNTRIDDQSNPHNETMSSAAVNLKCPILTIHGHNDEAVPISFALDTYKTVQQPPMNMRIQMRSIYGMKHFMDDKECFGMHEWIMNFVRKFPKWKVYREHIH